MVIWAATAAVSLAALVANLVWEFGPGLASAADSVGAPADEPAIERRAPEPAVAVLETVAPEPIAPPAAAPEPVADPDPIRCAPPMRGYRATHGCTATDRYPYCRWYLRRPRPSDPWRIWRNTTEDHRYGRPALVALILAAAEEYSRRWPGERLTVGDLDAPGPRHATHRRGVDVDLYLPHAMWERNELGGNYVDNYEDLAPEAVEDLRARVIDLARILATCADGRIRIYYNDAPVVERFEQWFEAAGLASDVGLPMEPHNDLHRFHFHLTIADDLSPLEAPAPPE